MPTKFEATIEALVWKRTVSDGEFRTAMTLVSWIEGRESAWMGRQTARAVTDTKRADSCRQRLQGACKALGWEITEHPNGDFRLDVPQAVPAAAS